MNRKRVRWGVLMGGCGILLAACSDDVSLPAGTSTPTDADAYVLLLDDDSQPDQVVGRPGAYALTARGAGSPPLAVLDVPAGYSNFGFFGLWPAGSGDEDPASPGDPFRAVNYWTVHGVFANPCDRHHRSAPEVGDSVEDLAAALEAQDLTSTTQPVPVSLDGHDGLYLELTVSPHVSFETCDIGYFTLWEAEPGDAQHASESPGTVERLWILDIDGERAVLLAATAPGVSRARTEELTDMIESVEFVPPQ